MKRETCKVEIVKPRQVQKFRDLILAFHALHEALCDGFCVRGGGVERGCVLVSLMSIESDFVRE